MQVFKVARCGKNLCSDAASVAASKKDLDELDRREKAAVDKVRSTMNAISVTPELEAQ